MKRKTIRLSRDLLEMAELGVVCPEYREIIKKLKEGVDVEKLPSDHILKQFVRKKKKMGEMMNFAGKVTQQNGKGLYKSPKDLDNIFWNTHTDEIQWGSLI